MGSIQLTKTPSTFDGIGYSRPRDGLPLETINSTAAEINDELRAMKSGQGIIGKVGVIVDRNRGADL
jgi:hypothetical protein